MKKFYLLLISIFCVVNLLAGGWYIPFMHDSPKSYIIPGLISSVYYEDPNPRYTINAHNKNKDAEIYNIYTADIEQLEARFEGLGIDKRLIEEVLKKLINVHSISYDDSKRNLYVHYSEQQAKGNYVLTTRSTIYQKFSLDNPISFNYPLYEKFSQAKVTAYFEYLLYKSIIHNKKFSSFLEKKRLKDRLAVKYKESNDKFLKNKYASLLIRFNIFSEESKVLFLENFNPSECEDYIALSDFAGYFFHASKKEDKHLEKSVYYFSLLSKNPKLIFNAFREVNFVLSASRNYKFSMTDCLSLCADDQERENLLFIMSNRFNGVNVSLLEAFAELTTINSPHFESLLINYVKRLVHVGIKEHSCDKKDDCSKCKEANDFYDFINDLKLSNKPLLYFLRGYTAFLIDDTTAYKSNFYKCRKSIKSSDLNYLEQRNFMLQLEGIELMDNFSRCSNIKEFKKLKSNLIEYINNTPLNIRNDSYFDAGVKKAIEFKDFVSAFEFSEKQGYTQSILLDVYMSDEEIRRLFKIVENGQLNFSYRFDKNIDEYLIELLAVKEFRRNNIDRAISYFKQTEKVETSESYALLIKKQFDNIQTIKESNISEYESGDLLADCYFKLAQLYSGYEWMYFSFWDQVLVYGLSYTENEPFNSLESDFVKQELLFFLNEYGGLQNAIKYYEKVIAVANDDELKAEASYELLKLYKKPYLTSFHEDLFRGNYSNYYRGVFDSTYIANAPDSLKFVYTSEYAKIVNLIDSLYKHTNYFNEVIAECGYLYTQSEKKLNINANEQNTYLHIILDFFKNRKGTFIFLLLFIIGLVVFYRIKKH